MWADSSVRTTDDAYTVDGRTYAVEWLLDETFEGSGWKDRWTVESQGPSVKAEEGWLRIRKGDMDKAQAGVTVWYDKDLPADIIVVVDAAAAPGDHACNLNFFLHATEADGAPLNYTRSGAYTEYHQIPNYLFTYTGGFMKGWSRARRNPGFTLVNADEEIRVEPGTQYEIVIVCQQGEISFYIDGELIHHYTDADPLPGGRFGLRTWFSDVDYDRIRLGRIDASHTQATD
ncbi:DUF6250 domain-containing protein [Ruficoccus sp. ZRK36]|uniref:DUF6250 domain-containing protein n=1 Tax=Ruficoccus sp. ZRK36 TaxID=2866311 RepID=UPI001C73A53A|nr:DUF6250 domain-containing protein [Ruficoccus sp. ZRK36]QYY35081.1 YesU family protein [Ruficoccus sp. ZRK36]